MMISFAFYCGLCVRGWGGGVFGAGQLLTETKRVKHLN